ncbi:uncharacterized protein LOC128311076 isoform X2 [Acinonyx jubatus]|uniref:Uncharacterized protein LOC128311076 isoform X2 n=1 Tax=Acinonyx jubatus TaxID=32536 RepID=A0ABM3N8H9_ACIJB|nr:uncharacterized protein LOC128311076 isoform X2 [Acinonyx jubatus]
MFPASRHLSLVVLRVHRQGWCRPHGAGAPEACSLREPRRAPRPFHRERTREKTAVCNPEEACLGPDHVRTPELGHTGPASFPLAWGTHGGPLGDLAGRGQRSCLVGTSTRGGCAGRTCCCRWDKPPDPAASTGDLSSHSSEEDSVWQRCPICKACTQITLPGPKVMAGLTVGLMEVPQPEPDSEGLWGARGLPGSLGRVRALASLPGTRLREQELVAAGQMPEA